MVVLIDHPNVPAVALPFRTDALYITLDDWESLHDQLRSTAAVIEYVQRALGCGVHPPLGHEFDRYRKLAQVDATYAARPGSLPILPLNRLSTDEALAVAAFDDLVERVADATNQPWDEHDYLHVVEMLDCQPVLMRANIGAKMLNTFFSVRESRRPHGFYARDAQINDRFAFFYDVEEQADAPDYDERHLVEIAAYGNLRHIQAWESGSGEDTRTLAVGVRHNDDRGRRYVFALFDGQPPKLHDEVRRSLEADHGIYDEHRGRTIRR